MDNGIGRSERAARARFRRVARERLKDGIVGLFLKQAWNELIVTIRQLHFRASENAHAVRAYCAMSVPEFEGVNARQKWANWRTIPRNLHGRLPARPCRAVDLCSGVGDSTEVLAYYLPTGSTILGLEYNPEFVRKARTRVYRDAEGGAVKTDFRDQSVLEAFRDPSGEPLADGSADVVNCCGALALNFDERSIDLLAGEIFRVLRTGGLALLDSLANGSGKEEMIRIFTRRHFAALGSVRSCFLDRYSQICFRRPSDLAEYAGRLEEHVSRSP